MAIELSSNRTENKIEKTTIKSVGSFSSLVMTVCNFAGKRERVVVDLFYVKKTLLLFACEHVFVSLKFHYR